MVYIWRELFIELNFVVKIGGNLNYPLSLYFCPWKGHFSTSSGVHFSFLLLIFFSPNCTIVDRQSLSTAQTLFCYIHMKILTTWEALKLAFHRANFEAGFDEAEEQNQQRVPKKRWAFQRPGNVYYSDLHIFIVYLTCRALNRILCWRMIQSTS